jgi:hypothetical protein
VTFLSYERAKYVFLHASWIKKYLNEVDNISIKDTSPFQDVKNEFFNLYSPNGNGDLAHHAFSNKKNK